MNHLKNLFLLCLFIMIGATRVMADDATVIYNETFGTVSSNTNYSSTASNLSDSKSGSYISTSSWKFSKSTTSPCSLTGSSGNSHIFSGTSNADLTFNFGDLTGYSSVTFTFNYRNEAAKGKDRTCTVKISSDGGTNWGDNILTSNTTQDWTTVTYNLTDANKANFSVKITNTSTNSTRIDDVMLTGVVATSKTDPTFTFTDGEVNMGNTLDLSTLLTNGSDATPTYTITEGSDNASITDGILTPTAVGTVSVKAAVTETSTYNAAEATATITISKGTLASPTNLQTTSVTSNSATLSWDAVKNASSYSVTITDNNDFLEEYNNISNTSYTFSNLAEGTTYTCVVTAEGGANYESANSDEYEFTTSATKTPASLAVTNTKTAYYVGDAFVTPTVIVTYTDDTQADVSGVATFTGFDSSVAAASQTIEVNYTEGGTEVTTSYTVTISEVPTYTITYMANGTQFGEQQSVVQGDALGTLPTGVAAIGDYTFQGWATQFSGKQQTAPTYITAETVPTANTTYYAVYAVSGVGNDVTETETIANIASANSWANGTAYTNASFGNLTITGAGTGNNCKYYTSDNSWRFYTSGDGAITITAPQNITKVILGGTDNFYIPDGWEYNEDDTYYYPEEGTNVSTVTFANNTSNTSKITSISVTYKGAATLSNFTQTVKTLSSIAVTNAPTEFVLGDEFSYEGAVVTATYTDNTTETVTASAEWSTPDMSSVGENTVTVTYTENQIQREAQYTITVTGLTLTASAPTNGTYTIQVGTADAQDVTTDETVTVNNIQKNTVVTLTQTPATDYKFGGWSVFKTDDPTTTLTVENGQFTLTDYSVTVQPTFVAKDYTSYSYISGVETGNSADATAYSTDSPIHAALSADNGDKTSALYVTGTGSATNNYVELSLTKVAEGGEAIKAYVGASAVLTDNSNTSFIIDFGIKDGEGTFTSLTTTTFGDIQAVYTDYTIKEGIVPEEAAGANVLRIYRGTQKSSACNIVALQIGAATETALVKAAAETEDATKGTAYVNKVAVVAGTEVAFTAEPKTNYHFTKWSDDTTDNPYNVTVSEATTLTASFALDQYTITAQPHEGGTYTVTVGDAEPVEVTDEEVSIPNVDYGTTIVLTPSVNSPRYIIDGAPFSLTVPGGSTTPAFSVLENDARSFKLGASDVTVNAQYVKRYKLTLAANEGNMTWNVNDTEKSTGDVIWYKPTTPATSIMVEVTAGLHTTFNSLTVTADDDTTEIPSLTIEDGLAMFDMPEADVTATANMTLQTTFTINKSVNDETMGALSVTLNDIEVTEAEEDAQVFVTATPNLGYRFTGWTVSDNIELDDKESAATYFIMPDEAVSVQANFEVIPTYALTITPDTYGTLELKIDDQVTELDANNQVMVPEGKLIQVTASPVAHYTFTSWSVTGVTSSEDENVVTFLMPTQAVTVGASFTEDAKCAVTFVVRGEQFGDVQEVYYDGTYAEAFDAVGTPTNDDIDFEDYTFAGWSTTLNETGLVEASATVQTGTLYAIFSKAGAATWTRVTSVDELTDGTQVVLTGTITDADIAEYTNTVWGAKAYDGSSTNVKSTQITVVDDQITSLGTGDDVAASYTIGVTTKDETTVYTFYDGTYYLYAASSSSNNLKGEKTLSDNGKWTISIENGECSIVAQGTNTRNLMKFNKNKQVNGSNATYNPLFNAYGSSTTGTTLVTLYKKTAGTVTYSAEYPDVEITITSATRGTFVSEYPLDFTDSEVIAYVCTGKDGDVLTMQNVKKVVAGEALYVAGTKGTYKVKVCTDTEYDEINGVRNYLVGVLPTTDNVENGLLEIQQVDGEYTNFILQKKDSGLKFYKVNGTTGNKVGVHRAYLQLPTNELSSNAKGYFEIDLGDGTTDIISVDTDTTQSLNGVAYDLNGRVTKSNAKGIVIVNGKKVFNK